VITRSRPDGLRFSTVVVGAHRDHRGHRGSIVNSMDQVVFRRPIVIRRTVSSLSVISITPVARS
jgi:hypothetical protein